METSDWFTKNWTKNIYSGKNIPKKEDDNYFIYSCKEYIRSLESGKLPFFESTKPVFPHHNCMTGVVYNGANASLLSIIAHKNKYADPRWIPSSVISKLDLRDPISGDSVLIATKNKFVQNGNTNTYERLYNVDQLSERDRKRNFSPVSEYSHIFNEIIQKNRNTFTENKPYVKKNLSELCCEANPEMPYLTMCIAQYSLCQQLQTKYTPSVTIDDLKKEFSTITKTKTSEIPQSFAKACYYADKVTRSLINKDRIYANSITHIQTQGTSQLNNQKKVV